ncbi:hypothetical protein C8R43DRAFT_1241306 [Mycena crocata]|nr:hypothetical protein C8R43DRAFT_1241306 [Mycena crocata]
MSLPLPSPQQAIDNPEKWDSEWDSLIRQYFTTFPTGPTFCFESYLSSIDAASGHDMNAYQDRLAHTCELQRNITEEALRELNFGNFEKKWMKAGSSVRGKHLLYGIAAVCSKSANLNVARAYSPELRLQRLRLSGTPFLDLLKSVMFDDASYIPSTPKYVSHPGWDSWADERRQANDTGAEKLALAEVLLLRTKLISHVVQFTFRSFLGLDPPVLVVRKEHKAVQTPQTRQMNAFHKAALMESLGPEEAKARIREEKAGAKARLSQRLGHCSYMGCTKTEPADGSVKFSRCTPCFTLMGLQVLYCSRICQSADWKLRHKAACGRPLDFETASQVIEHPTSAHNADKRIGPAINGYKRSLALAAQVTEINKCPKYDYHLYDRNNEPVKFDFGEGTYVQDIFRGYRERAMTTGDPECVAMIAHFLCATFLSKPPAYFRGVTPKMIVAQLAREYAFDGLREAVLEMQELQNRDPLKRPPLVANAPKDRWTAMITVMNFPEIVVSFD